MGVVLEFVVPSAATALTNLLFLSPITEIMRVDAAKSLGFFNPLPYPFMILNCLCWILYSLTFDSLSASLFLFFSNIIGLFVGFYCTFVCLPLSSERVQLYIRRSFLLQIVVYSFLMYFLVLLLPGERAHEALGYISTVAGFMFFGSPLSTLKEIIQTKSAKSIYWPLTVTAGISSLLWTIYAIVLQALPIIIPSAFSTLLSIIQMLLLWYYGHGDKDLQPESIVIDIDDKEIDS